MLGERVTCLGVEVLEIETRVEIGLCDEVRDEDGFSSAKESEVDGLKLLILFIVMGFGGTNCVTC